MKKFVWIVVGIIALILIEKNCNNNSISDETTKIDSSSNYSVNTTVENVQIKKEYPNSWAVKGMIRNNGSSNIKGAVKIKFLTSSGDIVHTTRAKVNDGDILKPGQAGEFDYYTKPENFNGVTDFDIEFYER
jgi:hypothetical protein